MKVLLIGSGGREHAIGWKLAQSPLITELISCPGNPGLAELGPCEPEVSPVDPASVTSLALRRDVDLVVVGPEAPLAAGVADALIDAGVAVFGPRQRGAMLESSKQFAKEMMSKAGVPTAGYAAFHDRQAALSHLRSSAGPYVVKADGLAAGKGVLVTADLTEAEAWVDACFDGRFGDAGATVVIEEHLEGDEVSTFFICSGGIAVPLEPARDYKRLLDGDEGPNTGGMGSYSPISDMDNFFVAWARHSVVEPTLKQLADDGVDYTGFLYVGLMLTADGPRVLEFNCRLGDPETQALMPRLDTDLLELLHAGAHGALDGADLTWSAIHAVDVVLAAPGYPEAPEKGLAIIGLDHVSEALVFHAGTTMKDGRLISTGGRVLNVVGVGDTTAEARADAYAAANMIQFRGKHARSDIAQK
ncbi:MAG: phosphoribosylamine--glycine ligase [Acidimicrobiia bacterium]